MKRPGRNRFPKLGLKEPNKRGPEERIFYMDSASATQIFLIVICIIFSAFFSASETAYSTFNRVRMKNEVSSGNKRAALALSLAEDYDRLLLTILVGNNIVNIASASLATIVFVRYLGDMGVSLSTAAMTILVLIFGEISPKSMAKEHAEGFALFAAPFLKILTTVLRPINFLFAQWKKLLLKIFKKKDESKITQEELMIIVDEAQNDGGIDEHNGALIRSAIEFNDMDANDVITPRVDIVAVEKNASFDEINDSFLSHSFSRLLVYTENIDNVVGMIHEKDFFRGLKQGITSLDPIIKKVLYITGSMKISDLLRLLQQTNTHIAVVVDEFGGTSGMVTLEDILEQLVGEIWDENDVVIDYFKKIDNTTWLVSGRASLEDMLENFGIEKDHEEYDSVTVSGWIMEELGKIPSVGDSFVFEKHRFTVTQIGNRNVRQVKVTTPLPEPDPSQSEKENSSSK